VGKAEKKQVGITPALSGTLSCKRLMKLKEKDYAV
jgi:hypothetical protein